MKKIKKNNKINEKQRQEIKQRPNSDNKKRTKETNHIKKAQKQCNNSKMKTQKLIRIKKEVL